jgi:hypothetical protein
MAGQDAVASARGLVTPLRGGSVFSEPINAAVERRKVSVPIARRTNAFARCSGGSIARSATGVSQTPSAFRRSIPSFEGKEKGTQVDPAPQRHGRRSVGCLRFESIARTMNSLHPPPPGEGKAAERWLAMRQSGVSASRFERMVASSRSSSRSRRRRDSSVIFPSRNSS